MLRVVVGGFAVAAAVLGGCGEQEGSSGPAGELADEVADAMATGADQVAERLGTEGVDVDAGDVRELDGGDVLCPVVRDPQPGDRATCRVELGGIDVEVDVEFGAEGESLTVIGVQAAP